MSYLKIMATLGFVAPSLARSTDEPRLAQELPPLPAKPKRFHKVAKSKRHGRKAKKKRGGP